MLLSGSGDTLEISFDNVLPGKYKGMDLLGCVHWGKRYKKKNVAMENKNLFLDNNLFSSSSFRSVFFRYVSTEQVCYRMVNVVRK